MGVPTPGTEVPERVDAILTALRRRHRSTRRRRTATRCSRRVHDGELLAFLEGAEPLGARGRTTSWSARTGWCPTSSRPPRCSPAWTPSPAAALHAQTGRFCYDTMTLVGPGTWEAARAAVDCALTAVDLVAAGERAAYALCRPPGHHVTRPGTAARATSTTPPSRPRRCATPGTSGWPWSTSTPTTATAPRRSSGSGRRALRVAARRPGGRLVPAPLRPRRRDRARRRGPARRATCRCPRGPGTAVAGGGRRPGRVGRAAGRAPRWSSRSASTPPPTTRRARCW